MNYPISGAVLALAASCVGCASGGLGTPPPVPAGRHLQFKHPVSGAIALRMTFPTPDACTGMLATLRFNRDFKEMQPYVSCVDASASVALPSRATVRNKTYAFLVEIEVINLSECKTFVDAMLSSEGKENIEVVMPCALR